MYIKAHNFNYTPIKNKGAHSVRKLKNFRIPFKYIQTVHMADRTVRNIAHYGR